MDYGEVLTRAWRIVWKYKVLWLFGILAGCGSAAGNTGGSGNRNVRPQFNFGNPGAANQYLDQIQRFFANIPIWVWVLLALAFLALIVFFAILGTLGRTGLVLGAVQGDEDAPGLSFGPLFSRSLKYFWRVFLLNLLVGLIFFILIAGLIVVVALIGVLTAGVALICLVPLLCILIPVLIVVGWLVGVVVEQSIIAMVSEERGIFDGLARGWDVVRAHIGTYILMALILYIGGGILSFLVAIPMALIVIPPVIGALSGTQTATLIGVGIAVILFIIYLPILLVLTGIIRAYITTAWTLTFRRLTHPMSPIPGVEVIPPSAPAGPAYYSEPVPPAPPVPYTPPASWVPPAPTEPDEPPVPSEPDEPLAPSAPSAPSEPDRPSGTDGPNGPVEPSGL
jgi:hypothetical protein